MFVFFMNVPNWNFKKFKNIYIWPQISQKVIFSVGTFCWRFNIFLFFSKSTSDAVIPWDLDLYFCTWQAHFWSNVRGSAKRIRNNINLWKKFEEHFSEHFRCHIFQLKYWKKVSFIRNHGNRCLWINKS